MMHNASCRRSLRWPGSERWILWSLAVIIGLLSVAPLVRLIWAAIAPQGVPDSARLWRLLHSAAALRATGNTLLVSLGATAFSLLLGTLAAWLVALSDIRARAAWVFVFILPLMIPPQVTALAWIQAMSPSGFLMQFLTMLGFTPGSRPPLYSMGGMILLLGLHNAPLVFLSVRAGLQRMPANLVEAAQVTGASPLRVLLTVILPLARPAIFAGAALSFVAAAGNFGIQAMLGIPARIPTLITLIYQKLNSTGPGALPDMAVLSLFLAVITLGGMLVSGLLGGWRNVRVSGTTKTLIQPLGRWRLLVEIVAWLLMALILLLPLSALLETSLTSGFGQELNWQTITLLNYRNALFDYPAIRHAFFISVGLTLITVVILTVMALFMACYLSWRRSYLVRVLHLSSELAYALPGVVTGIAALLFFLRPLPLINVSLYGTVWIILAAYLSNFLVLVLRPTLAGFARIERSMDEAAQLSGAGFLRRMRDILLPMVAPSLIAGAILVFLTALNEIQVSILLVTSATQTLGPTIVFLDEGGSSTLAAAVGCLMIFIVTGVMLLASWCARKQKGILPWQL